MDKIVKIEEIKYKKNKCTLFALNKEYDFAKMTLAKYNIHKDMEIPIEKFWELINESDKILCKEYLFDLISKYQKTEKGYKDKLYSKGYHKNAVDNAILLAKNYGYINDENYCKNYILTYKNKKGINRLKNELYQKGISQEISDKYLYEIEDTQLNIATEFARKWCKRYEYNYETREKLIRHLVGKGFTFDVINSVLHNLSDEN